MWIFKINLEVSQMNIIDKNKTAGPANENSFVTIFVGDDSFKVPLWVAERINYYIQNEIFSSKSAYTVNVATQSALQFTLLGLNSKGTEQNTYFTLAKQICEDEWHCGNEIKKWPIPHPHWTDTYKAIEQHAASFPETSVQRMAALHLCSTLLKVGTDNINKSASEYSGGGHPTL